VVGKKSRSAAKKSGNEFPHSKLVSTQAKQTSQARQKPLSEIAK
jgi:hypothetical protein